MQRRRWTLTLPPSDDPLDGDRGEAAEELDVHVTVNGTTFVAVYEVKDAAVLLFSADFGEASAALDGLAPEAVAARLLQGLAEAGVARSSAPYMRDDEANPHGS